MVTDALLGILEGIMTALIAVLPAWSYVVPPGGGSTAMSSVIQYVAPYNGVMPVEEILTVLALVSSFMSVMLIVKFLVWLVERFYTGGPI